ncbi:uncharacterized protein GIQ15_01412 [Arthroderma uncinatum]|uniref:uncharacterized protein n=1 Tax=Arthroderma uncinatum TaxID=74035 RepID=UPI00144AC73B|nr:uncharacterized protein GIQ15_01412 [Arthroderma uncinatum]KAF3491895.1 hypothetical protein GIQ15_01412 [Arthroderma uncinatum]
MMTWMNRTLKGQKASYKLLEMLKEPSLYKAAVLPSSTDSSNPASTNKFVAIKDLVLERELRVHQHPAILGCKYIRQAVDVIEKGKLEDWSPSPLSVSKRMALEWMDTDLWLLRPYGKPFSNPKLPAIVTKSILEALVVFQNTNGGLDVNPNNIFLSNLESPTPIVKLGDLDNAFSEGVAKNYQGAQTHETRAPEVWRGLGVWHSSDVWSLGVTDHQTAWCLAKIFRLVGHIETPENPDFKGEFEFAQAIEGGGYLDPKTGEAKPYISVGTLREELQKIPREICSDACIDFLEHVLVIDPAKRPTAEMALKHAFVASITV